MKSTIIPIIIAIAFQLESIKPLSIKYRKNEEIKNLLKNKKDYIDFKISLAEELRDSIILYIKLEDSIKITYYDSLIHSNLWDIKLEAQNLDKFIDSLNNKKYR